MQSTLSTLTPTIPYLEINLRLFPSEKRRPQRRIILVVVAPICLLPIRLRYEYNVYSSFADILVHQFVCKLAPIQVNYQNPHFLLGLPIFVLSFTTGHSCDPVMYLRLFLFFFIQMAHLGSFVYWFMVWSLSSHHLRNSLPGLTTVHLAAVCPRM